MQKYTNVVQDNNGTIIAGVTVTVKLAGTGTLASLFSDNGVTGKANPFTNDTDGSLEFYATNGRYDITYSKTGYTFDALSTSDSIFFDPLVSATTYLDPVMTGLMTLTGGQIAFPATQVPSASVNVLDDYEEGTWTPSVGGNASYTFQVGYYVKIGSLVTVQFALVINVLGTGSTGTISGLPFTVSNAQAFDPIGSAGAWATLTPAFVFLNVRAPRNTNNIVFDGATAAAASLTSAVSMFQNGSLVQGSIAYKATN